MVIRRFGVWSVARLAAVLYAGLGLIFGALFAAISLVGAGIASAIRQGAGDTQFGSGGGAFTALFGVGAIIMFPILYGIIGLVFGALTAALYNLVAGVVGGVEVQLEQ